MKCLSARKALENGFTLIELVVVIVVIGILSVVTASQFGTGISDSAKSAALWEATTKLTDSWRLFTSIAGVSSSATPGTTPAPISPNNSALDILISGKPYVAKAYQSAWDSSGLVALSDLGRAATSPTSTTAGVYEIAGYVSAMSGGNDTSLVMTYANVPDNVVTAINTKYGTGTVTSASNMTSSVIQWGPSVNGLRKLMVLKQP